MDSHCREILAFLDDVHASRRHPFAEFLQALRGSTKNCIFGVGEWASNVFAKLTRPEVGVTIHCCCDNDARKWGKTFLGGVPCISLPELLAMKDEASVLIVTERHCGAIYPQLKAAGVQKVYALNKEYLILYADALKQRVEDDAEFSRFRAQVAGLLNLLADEQSRRTAATIIRNWFTFSPFQQEYQGITVPDQYFPHDLVHLSDQETFVDLGAYDGASTLDFLARAGKHFRAAYAFEMDENNFRLLSEVVGKRNGGNYQVKEVLAASAMAGTLRLADPGPAVFLCRFGIGSQNGQIRYQSQCQASAIDPSGDCLAEIARLDDVLDGRPVTLLKMDIEGAEMDALSGATETIRRWKPKIAACVYHNPDHLLQIPPLLKRLVPDYRLYLRHHAATDLETVCYAI